MSRHRRRKWIIIAAVALGLLGLARFFLGSPAGEPVGKETSQLLEAEMIPHLEFKDATAGQVVDQLNQMVGQGNLRGRIKFAMWEDRALPRGYHIARNPLSTAKKTALDWRISMTLPRIPMGEVLHYISKLTGSEPAQHGDTIYFMPEGTFEAIQARTYQWSPAALGSTAPALDARKIEDFLSEHGVVFYEGCGVSVVKSNSTIRIYNTERQLRLCESILGAPAEPTLFEKVKWWGWSLWYCIRRFV